MIAVDLSAREKLLLEQALILDSFSAAIIDRKLTPLYETAKTLEEKGLVKWIRCEAWVFDGHVGLRVLFQLTYAGRELAGVIGAKPGVLS